VRSARFSLLTALLVTASLQAQSSTRILTGPAAAERFVYQGRPLHPFCLDFSQERSSRSAPRELVTCSATNVVPKREDNGWWSANYPTQAGQQFIAGSPYVSYAVLASKGDRFLVGTNSSGGGTGNFSNLFWVRLEDRRIALVKDERGGDRCVGGLADYKAQGTAVTFSVNASSSALLELTGVRVDEGVSGKLNSSYVDCDGVAMYRYDLKAEQAQLTAVQINTPDVRSGTVLTGPQSCFNQLVLQYAKRGAVSLNPGKLKEFGRQFAAKCAVR
jgi:hypothetical protein